MSVRNPWREELHLARRHLKRLETMAKRLADMASEWDGLSGALECDFNFRAEEMENQVDVLREQINEWRRGDVEKDDF